MKLITTTLSLFAYVIPSASFIPPRLLQQISQQNAVIQPLLHSSPDDDDEFFVDDGLSSLLTQKQSDLSGCTTRQFRLGYDILLSRSIGSMGFDQVVDWEYFDNDPDANEERRRNVVEPPPLDPTKPKRTRSSSGSVVRLFRGELSGRIGSSLRAAGKDNRVMVKEFEGEIACELAMTELTSLGKLQSELLEDYNSDVMSGEWSASASLRYLRGLNDDETRKDDIHLQQLLEFVSRQPIVGLLGQLNLQDYFDDPDYDPNEWYRALSVPPPKPDSIFLVYEYTGLATAQSYARPPLQRIQNLPLQKGFFGNPIPPPPLPSFDQRADYLIQGVFRQALQGLAKLHECNVAHRSIGLTSMILSTPSNDKTEATSPYTTSISRLNVKFADFGFAGLISDAKDDAEFVKRARGFGLVDEDNGTLSAIDATNFAMAEDLHALGFAFLGLLLTTLAEPTSTTSSIPKTDEDTLQRLIGEIFQKDMGEFREYCEAEEVWTKVVKLLDEKEGWDVLDQMCFARERVKDGKGTLRLITARGLLGSRFFQKG